MRGWKVYSQAGGALNVRNASLCLAPVQGNR
jgi:hypothetical protein